MGILDDILSSKQEDVRLLQNARERIVSDAQEAPVPRDFLDALNKPGVGVVGEIKRRSPSKGVLNASLDPAKLAVAYQAGGAIALSVLTEERYFAGAPSDLKAAKAATRLPALRKDFIFDDLQIYESRAIGADAVLLIAAAFEGPQRLSALVELAHELSLATVVEVRTEAELETALESGAQSVGINARDLSTFSEDLSDAVALRSKVPAGVITIAESAIRSPSDMLIVKEAGFDAALIGEAFVTVEDPDEAVRSFVEGGL